MKRTGLWMVIFLSAVISHVEAGTMGEASNTWGFVSTLSMGPVWENAGVKQTFSLAPEIEKTYTAAKSRHTLIDGELFLGGQKRIQSTLLGHVGISVAAANSAKLSGHIWDDASPVFDNYTYTYKVKHTHVALKGKLLSDSWQWFMPWISASLGLGWNQAHDFNNTPIIFEALPNENFTSHTKTAFTYTLGAGVQRSLNAHWQAGVGYEFADWGKSRLGRALGQTMNAGLALNHLYTHGVLLNLTYLA